MTWLRHLPVAFDKFGSGAANALAGRGEGVDDFLDGVAEIAGEKQPAGVMQPRFGFAAKLVDSQCVSLDQRGTQFLRGAVKALDRSVAKQIGQVV